MKRAQIKRYTYIIMKWNDMLFFIILLLHSYFMIYFLYFLATSTYKISRFFTRWYANPKTFNQIDNQIKNTTSLNVFKFKLKQFFFMKYHHDHDGVSSYLMHSRITTLSCFIYLVWVCKCKWCWKRGEGAVSA